MKEFYFLSAGDLLGVFRGGALLASYLFVYTLNVKKCSLSKV